MSAIHLRSPFPLEECARRLAAAMDPDAFGLRLRGWWDANSRKPVVGRVRGTSLRLRKHINYRNSFQSCLTAELLPAGTGTIITGRVGIEPFVVVFMVCWLGLVCLIGGSAIMSVLIHPGIVAMARHGSDGWPLTLVPPGMLIFGCCLFGSGRLLARGEDRFLTDHLARALAAEPVPGI